MDNNNIESVSPTSELINAILNDNNNIEVAFCDTLDANNTKNEEDTRVDLNSISSNSGDEPVSILMILQIYGYIFNNLN